MANSRVDHARQKEEEEKEDTRYNYATQRRGREIKTGELRLPNMTFLSK